MSTLTGGDRIQRLTGAMSEAGIDAFFAADKVSMRYLAGFPEDGHERFLTLAINGDRRVCMICPALSEQQARRAGIQDVRTWNDGEDPLALFQELAKEWGLRSGILAVDDMMHARQLLDMQSVLPAALFKPGQPVLGSLMSRKDSQEIEAMRVVGAIADKAYPAAFEVIRPGVSEERIARALSDAMSELGGSPTFCIVGTGANGAEPHHETDRSLVKPGDVLVLDFGCELEGYQSDITRCVCCGPANEEARKVYRTVYDAHMAGRDAVRPGVAAQDVDRATRRIIEKGGYGDYFVHRTGHGIGMRGHEEPYIVEGNQHILEEGNCFSIEPGIYLPGRFGVRIENIVAVTASGHESMNEEPASDLYCL